MRSIDPALTGEIRRLADEGRKVDAIRLLRTRQGLSLGEATEVLQVILRGGDPDTVLNRPAAVNIAQTGRRFDRASLLCLLVFVTLGGGLLATAAWLAKRESDLKTHGIEVRATVVENLPARRGFTPVFAFEWEGGMRTVPSPLTSSVNGRPVHQVGDSVILHIDPADPGRIGIDDWFHSWFAPTLLGFIGAMLLLVGGGVSLLFIRR